MAAFLKSFSFSEKSPVPFAEGLFGYSTYDSVQFFEKIAFAKRPATGNTIPLMRYRFYQYVIAINHFKDEMFLIENGVDGQESEFNLLESLIRNKDFPSYPFAAKGQEQSNMTDEDYMTMVEKGKQHCFRGDVFQIVLSRAFHRNFSGDEFNVYRALRSINPSPYLFYFDYGRLQADGLFPGTRS